MPGLVQEGLVVVQPALRARDQVDDLRRVGRDDTCTGRLLRTIVEVELDVRIALRVEAEPRERVDAHGNRALLRVDALERREAPEVGDVRGARDRLALRAEQTLGPALVQVRVDVGRGVARRGKGALALA